jgi:hypothetical protein
MPGHLFHQVQTMDDDNKPPQIRPSKEAVEAARRAIEAGKVFEFVG